MHVDPSLYSRPWRFYDSTDLARYRAELYGRTRRLFALYRDVADITDRASLDAAVPRTPVCTRPGTGCWYTGPCVHDSPEAREDFELRLPVLWLDDPQQTLTTTAQE